ncbi:head completion/stabilization protein [Paraburkholderia bonniea]|uniref:head completion/stabilization protein n=1 Tax=Paraburkholderia bonniea TaxID=2152891 RepID=UPI0012915FEC|nr:head completion/stabilization protein [Paraburkholderia bonniea]
MSSFFASPPNPAPQPDTSTLVIKNDSWFPDIDLIALRASARFDGTVTHERLRESAIDAISSVNEELAEWRFTHADSATLADVPAPKIGGESMQVARYRRAVYSLAHADLTERYRDLDTTKSGGQKAEELEETICQSRRNARWALNDLRGIARTTIELI